MRIRPLLAFAGLLFVLTACSTAVLVHQLTRPSDHVVQTWKRPDGLICLSIVEGDTDWRGLALLSTRQRYYLYVGRDCGQPSYGHFIDFTPGGYLDTADLFKKSTVEWGADGVTFMFPEGHRLFIPKVAYERGR